jgi:hypothetical protein
MNRKAFPHSEISGSKVACTSPELIAAGHVLHRLSAPRHPPRTLSSLTTKIVSRGPAWSMRRSLPIVPSWPTPSQATRAWTGVPARGRSVRVNHRGKTRNYSHVNARESSVKHSSPRFDPGDGIVWFPYGTLFTCQRSSRRPPAARPRSTHGPGVQRLERRGVHGQAPHRGGRKRDGPGRSGKCPLRRRRVPPTSKSSRP